MSEFSKNLIKSLQEDDVLAFQRLLKERLNMKLDEESEEDSEEESEDEDELKEKKSMSEESDPDDLRNTLFQSEEDKADAEAHAIADLQKTAVDNQSVGGFNYHEGVFAFQFKTKKNVTDFCEFLDSYYWVREYEVYMDMNNDGTFTEDELLADLYNEIPDDLYTTFQVIVSIDSSIVQYDPQHETEPMTESRDLQEVAQIRAIKAIGGKLVKVTKTCERGMSGGECKKTTGSERQHRMKGALKRLRTMGSSGLKLAHKKALKTLTKFKTFYTKMRTKQQDAP